MSKRPEGTCHLCGNEVSLTFEHIPPESAFNNNRVEIFGLQHWLQRAAEEQMHHGKYQQRGAGGHTLCASCNNNTGRWYVHELAIWASLIVQQMGSLPSSEDLDRMAHPTSISLKLERVHPLRFLKQFIVMLFSVNAPDFRTQHPELVEFVLNREKTGLSPRYQFYLSLFLGPMARSVGLAGKLDLRDGEFVSLTEISYKPFSYLMTIDAPYHILPCGNITNFADCDYEKLVNLEIDLLVGFGNTPYPGDYRSKAAMTAKNEDWSFRVPFSQSA